MSIMTSLNTSYSGFGASNTLLNTAASSVSNLFGGPVLAPRNSEEYGDDFPTDEQISAATINDQPGYYGQSDIRSAEAELSADVVQMTQAKQMYTASAMLTRAAERMLGTMLDVTSKD